MFCWRLGRLVLSLALVVGETALGALVIQTGWEGVVERKRFMNEESRRNYGAVFRDIPRVAKQMLVADALLGSWAVGWAIVGSLRALLIGRRQASRLGLWFRLGVTALLGFHLLRAIVSDSPSRGRLGIYLAGIGDDSGYAFFTHFTADIWLSLLALCGLSVALVFGAEALVTGASVLRDRIYRSRGQSRTDQGVVKGSIN